MEKILFILTISSVLILGNYASDKTSSIVSFGFKQAIASEKPVIPEKNPPGDIPDNQVFITYRSKGNYQIKVPEGWARQTKGNDVSFINKLDGIEITITPETTAPTLATVKTKQVPQLELKGRAVKVLEIKEQKLSAGQAILIKYNSNSEPDGVTNKQVRLENINYLFFKKGKLITIRLWAPQGADNVDQWQLISNSFRWL